MGICLRVMRGANEVSVPGELKHGLVKESARLKRESIGCILVRVCFGV